MSPTFIYLEETVFRYNISIMRRKKKHEIDSIFEIKNVINYELID
jgi:hypothetical protein